MTWPEEEPIVLQHWARISSKKRRCPRQADLMRETIHILQKLLTPLIYQVPPSCFPSPIVRSIGTSKVHKCKFKYYIGLKETENVSQYDKSLPRICSLWPWIRCQVKIVSLFYLLVEGSEHRSLYFWLWLVSRPIACCWRYWMSPETTSFSDDIISANCCHIGLLASVSYCNIGIFGIYCSRPLRRIFGVFNPRLKTYDLYHHDSYIPYTYLYTPWRLEVPGSINRKNVLWYRR